MFRLYRSGGWERVGAIRMETYLIQTERADVSDDSTLIEQFIILH